MKITGAALNRPVAVTVLTIAILITGIFSIYQLDVNYLPNISYPMVKIYIWWRGATPEDIETNIADPLEEILATVDDLDYLESSSIEGMYVLMVNFRYGVEVEVAYQDVIAAMGRVAKRLPRDIDPPAIVKADPAQLPVIELMISSDQRNMVWLREWSETWLLDRLTTVPGTAGAEVVGGQIREIRVHLDPSRLQAYKISTAQVAKALHEENLQTFAGRITIEPREIIARTMGEYESLEEIRNVVVKIGIKGEKVYLKDIAKVEDSHEEMRIDTHYNGKPCIEYKVLKQYAANAVTVATDLKAKLKELRNDIPDDIKIGYVEDESTYVLGAIHSVENSAILAGILVILVIYFFLGRWRQVLVMIVALPITLLGNFLLMRALDLSINVFSLGGLVVALGVILDNSIVVLENISRLKSEGHKYYAYQGLKEVGSAIFTSTLTFLAIFLPFMFVPGMAVLLFKELILVVGGVVVVSLLVAITLTPLITDRLLKNESEGKISFLASGFDKFIGLGITLYKRLLDICLNVKTVVVFITIIGFCFGIWLTFHVGTEFLPRLDDGRVMIKLKMPSGTSVGRVNEVLEKIEKNLSGIAEIESMFRLAGGRVFGQYTLEVGNEGNLNIQLVPKSKRKITTMQFIKKIRPIVSKVQKTIPGSKIPVKPRKIKGLRKVGEQDIEVNVKGSNTVLIYEFAELLADTLEKTSGFTGVNISMDMTKPEYRIYLDRARASAMGITVKHIATTMKTLVQGMVSTQYREGSEYYNIRVMIPEIKINNKTALENLVIDTRNGEPIYLKDVAEVRRAVGPVEISREDQVMRVIVRADASGISVGEAISRAEKITADLKTPSGVEFSMGSQARFMAESRGVMGRILGFAIMFAYVILAIQFESFMLPFLIILNIPLTLTGALLALYFTGGSVGVTVQIGVLVMMGGITSQGVVLLTTAEEYRQNGLTPLEAIKKAAPIRVRPILMTQLTTVLGLVPLALNLGEGGDMLVTMAIAVIGGLLYSLLLTLFFLPAGYNLIYKESDNVI